jgi:hypothetical protein
MLSASAASLETPYWDDATKSKVNVYSNFTIYKVGEQWGPPETVLCLGGGGSKSRLCVGRLLLMPDLSCFHLQGKAAMSIKVIKPTWEPVGSGLKISREGTLLLEFAQSVGPQQYDWSRKEVRS